MKDFYKKLLQIAVPITVQGLITSSINLMDVFMIGKLGGTSIAAVGLANQITLLLIISLFGINSAGVIFVSQFYGKKDYENIKKIVALCSLLSCTITLFFVALSLSFPAALIEMYTPDRAVIAEASGYLRVVAGSYFFTAFSIALGQLLSGMSKTKEAMFGSIIALCINVTLNYLLIFGKFGFPELGILGAAIATTTARFFEFFTLLTLSVRRNYPVFFSYEECKNINRKFIQNYCKTALPVMGSYAFWVLGTTTLTAIYARIGTEAIIAINIFNSIEKIVSTGIIAMSCAAGIIIGQELGRDKISEAINIAKKVNITGFSFAMIMAASLGMFIDFIIKFYNITPEVTVLTKQIMLFFCFLLPFITLNSINMMGTLKAGGETKLIFFVDMICMWGTSVPLAFAGFFLKLPMKYVYLIAIGSGEAVKLTVSMFRVISLKWAKNLT